MRRTAGTIHGHAFVALACAAAATAAAALGGPRAGEPQEPGAATEPAAWTAEIRPLLERYCFSCHGPEKHKSGVRFDEVSPDLLHGPDGETWADALDVLEFEEMPPPDEAELFPTGAERAKLVAWIRGELETAAAARAVSRRTVMRRINREQYARSLQDLLGITLDYAWRLPDDGLSLMGFSNDGETLRASAMHLEAYQAIARDALDQAMALGGRPEPARYLVRLGRGVGAARPGAQTGGYQAVPLAPEDFIVDVLDAGGAPRAAADEAAREEIRRVQSKVTVGLRGSSQDRFHVVPEGVILYGALPHKEVAPGSWQGPSPNIKLEMQRVFPDRGDFVLRVRASRGYLVSERKELLVAPDDPAPSARAAPRPAGAPPGDAGLLDRQPAEFGPWFLAGPIPAATSAEMRATVYVDAPFVDFEAPLKDGITRWRLAGDIDGKVQSYSLDRGVAILARTIVAPSARTMEIAVGSDDACWIWVNGRPVLERDVQRGVAPDQDFVSVPLAAGRNDLVFKIVNDQGGFGSYHRLIHDGTRREPPPWTLESRAGARVLAADRATELQNLRFERGMLVAENFPAESRARFSVDLPAGWWQFDLAHPALAPNAMGSVRLEVDGLRLDQRPICDAGQLERGFAVTPLGVGFLNAGRRTITLGGPFFTGFGQLVLTPLGADHPQVARLEAQSEAEQSVELPALRAFIGTRTDDGMDYAEFDAPRTVTAPLGEPATYEFRGRLENLPIPEPESGDLEILSGIMVLGVWNDHLVKSRDDPGPPLLIESLEFEAPWHPVWPPESRARVLPEGPSRGGGEAWARAALAAFLPRAFRREVGADELARYLAYWRSSRPDCDSDEAALRETLVAALCSPSFLFLVEPEDARDPEGRIGEDLLATRLAYFLWNGPPDAELASLARAGRLRAELDAQTARLLDDPRSEAFVRAFAREWLRMDRLDSITINPNRFPDFTRFVKRDMEEETWRFVARVLREDLPLATLVDSDFAMLNQNLAEFYGVPGVLGIEFRPVPLPPGSGRGGLIGQGSFLAGHSDGEEPHPIKRAAWIKARLLGQPPKPPPPNVPALDPTQPDFERLTLKEKLERHRDNPSCHDCHASFDPYGVALESYDAVGRIATERKGRPVDASAVLPDGTAVDGPAGLRAWLRGPAAAQVRDSVVRHLFAYALGRSVDFADEAELDALSARVAAEGGTLRAAVRAVVQSRSFRDL